MDALESVNGGPHPGFRAVHAKGTICSGTFTPTPAARELSRAAHLQGDPVETTVRFSNASGHPRTPDADPLAGRGMAVKFHLPDGDATDIVSVPLVVFFARNAEDFLEMTRARIPDPETGQPDPEKLGAYLAEHPEAGVALQKAIPKLAPTTSFATSDYRALHAFGLVDADGGIHWGRYTWEPEDGTEYLTDEQRDAAEPQLPPGGDPDSASPPASPGSPSSSPWRTRATRSRTRRPSGRASTRWSSSANSR